MKFGKILNREKTSSRTLPKNEEKDLVPQEKVDAERLYRETDLPDIPRIAPIGRIQENEPRKPEVPHLRIAEKRNDEDLWPSNFSDAPSTNYNISARAEEYNQHNLPPLQFTNENEVQARGLAPLAEDVVDPEGFDLAPAPRDSEEGRPDLFSLERRSLLMFSKTHLRVVFEDLKLLRKFSAFLVEHRPDSVPLLVYHLEARKALAAIKYTNAITRKMKPLGSLGFTHDFAPKTSNEVLIQKAEASFEVLANQDLPAWITSVWMKAVEASIRRRINGTLPSQLRDMSEGLAETFVLSDPARYDNPILFASEEFNRLTLYGNKHVIGRNCRIFQGPQTNPHGIRRLREKLDAAEQHYEPLLNYRRDGSPFMNLLMITPLLDANGKVRYYLGAQIDTSGLLNDFYGFEYLHQYVDREGYQVGSGSQEESCFDSKEDQSNKDELQELSELLDHQELDTVRKHGGRLHRPDLQESEPTSTWKKKKRLVIAPDSNLVYDDDTHSRRSQGLPEGWHDDQDATSRTTTQTQQPRKDSNGSNGTNGTANNMQARNGNMNGRHNGSPALRGNEASHNRIMSPGSDPSFLSAAHHPATASFDAQDGGHLGGVYNHYLLVRPAPHLRILFASPTLRIPGMVQSELMDHVGGPPGLRAQIEQALHQGQGVTAKVRWLTSPRRPGQEKVQGGLQQPGRSRWFHATPLLGRNGEVGVWMVVLVDEEKENGSPLSPRQAGYARSIGTASMRSAGRETLSGQRPPSVRSRKESSGSVMMFNNNGMDQGPMMMEPEADRMSVGDGLRPPPRTSTSSLGRKAAIMYD